MIRVAAICGLLTGPVFIVGWVAGGLAQPDEYSFLEHAVSDLGAKTADSAWLYNRLGGNLTGLLLLAFAVGLWRSLGRRRSARIGAVLVGVVGVGQLLDGFFREDCRELDTWCEGHDASWRETVHGIESMFTILALVLAPFVLARALKLAPRWRELWLPTLALGIGTIMAFGGAGAMAEGLGVLMGTSVWFAWIAVLAVRMLHLAGESASDASPAREAPG